jgi:hypothetical protein
MVDSFLAGLVAGAVVGFAGLSLRLLQLGALVAVAGLAWIIVERGPAGIEPLFAEAVEFVKPYTHLLVGAVFGAVLGRSVLERMRGRVPD